MGEQTYSVGQRLRDVRDGGLTYEIIELHAARALATVRCTKSGKQRVVALALLDKVCEGCIASG